MGEILHGLFQPSSKLLCLSIRDACPTRVSGLIGGAPAREVRERVGRQCQEARATSQRERLGKVGNDINAGLAGSPKQRGQMFIGQVLESSLPQISHLWGTVRLHCPADLAVEWAIQERQLELEHLLKGELSQRR